MSTRFKQETTIMALGSFFRNFKLNFIIRNTRNIINVSRRHTNPTFRKCCSKPGRTIIASLGLIPVVSAFGFGRSTKEEKKVEQTNPELLIIEKADKLYSENNVNDLYSYLVQYKESDNAEILWRICRAACDKAKSSDDKNKRKELMYEAFEHIKKALSMNDKIFAVHKWYAIMLDYVGEYEGTKQRLTNAFKVKEHFMKAIELNPQDATSVHLLGYWCFVFAELPWYQQKIASVIFTSPPSSTYEEALGYFDQAEKIDPGFYSLNLLYIGKTHLRLKNKDKAKCYLTRVMHYPVKTPDDKQAHKEAEELLKTL